MVIKTADSIKREEKKKKKVAGESPEAEIDCLKRLK